MDVKGIDKKQREFMANGRKYIIMEKISIERFKQYEKLVPQLTMGITFNEMFASLRKAFGLLNNPTPKPLDAGIIIHNLMSGISASNDEKRFSPALMMAALIINREDEDPGKYDEQLMLDKIADWQAEGYDMLDFFELSLNAIQGFRETLIKYTQETAKLSLKED